VAVDGFEAAEVIEWLAVEEACHFEGCGALLPSGCFGVGWLKLGF